MVLRLLTNTETSQGQAAGCPDSGDPKGNRVSTHGEPADRLSPRGDQFEGDVCDEDDAVWATCRLFRVEKPRARSAGFESESARFQRMFEYMASEPITSAIEIGQVVAERHKTQGTSSMNPPVFIWTFTLLDVASTHVAAPKTPMSSAHKEALAIGRAESRTVRTYLEALQRNRPKRGRKRTPDSIRRRLKAIDADLQTADPITKLKLTQEKIDLGHELDELSFSQDIGPLEKEFVSVAKSYGERNGITYTAWREIGVEPAVLKKAGITRS